MKRMKSYLFQAGCQLGAWTLFLLSIPFFAAGIVLIPPVLVFIALAICFALLVERMDEAQNETPLMRIAFFALIVVHAISLIASIPDILIVCAAFFLVKEGGLLLDYAHMFSCDSVFVEAT